jgi:hypothetical protein
MFVIPNEIKEFVQAEKEYIRPVIVLNMLKDIIVDMLAYNIPKKYILEKINRELGLNINYYTFVSFVKKISPETIKRRKNGRDSVARKPSATPTTDSALQQTGADAFLSKLTGGVKIKKGI